MDTDRDYNFDMLDDAPHNSQGEVIQYPELNICDDENSEQLLSSSPMSLSGDSQHALTRIEENLDEDSTSHLYGNNEPARSMLQPVNTIQAVSIEDVPAHPQTPSTTTTLTTGRIQDQVIAQIESVFEGIADSLLAGRNELSLVLNAHIPIGVNNGIGRRNSGSTRSTAVTFPGKSSEEAWRFTIIIRLLELLHEAICSGIVLTKRDLYYRDPALFGKQSVVDRYIDHIALAFGVARSSMNVTAAAKGLIAGSASFCRRDGSRLDLLNSNGGVLIPNREELLSVDMTAAQWVIVIEKEATFQSIITSEEWQSLRWQCVLVTGKGYPDIATRAAVHFMTRPTPQNGFIAPKVYGLMDYDPDGLAILTTYKHGSIKLRNEGEDLVVQDMKWLGLDSSHITDGDETHRNQGLMPLTKRDRKKARNMLQQNLTVEEDSEWRGQLQVMLMLNLKAELQILDTDPGALIDLIKSAMQ